jgi:hypothetical protein
MPARREWSTASADARLQTVESRHLSVFNRCLFLQPQQKFDLAISLHAVRYLLNVRCAIAAGT